LKKLYMAYGDCLNVEHMAQICPTAKPVGTSILKDYELLFRGEHGSAVATVERVKGKAVPVLLWEISDSDEEAIDRNNGYPNICKKEKMKVKLDTKNVEAMMYILNEKSSIGKPSLYYYKTIRSGYESAEFEIKILEQAMENSNENTE
jgi:hypothetical protein